MDDKLSERVDIRLTQALKRATEIQSARTGIPVSTLLRRALEQWLSGEWHPFAQPGISEQDGRQTDGDCLRS